MSIDNDAARLDALESQYEELGQEIARLKGQILAAAKPGDAIEVAGRPRWIVQPGKRRFVETKAMEVYSMETLQACTTTRLDSAALKRHSEVLWELSCEQGEPFLRSVTR